MLSSVQLAVTLAVIIGAGYLIGSLPVANLVARREAGVDLRSVGDRNPGYWNAKEVLGRRRAVPVFIGDALKGVAAAGIATLLATNGQWWLAYVGTGAAMVGHAFPVFAQFRGGRSLLTFVGGAIVFTSVPAAISIAVLAVVMLATRSFALAVRSGFVALPFVQIAIEGPYRTAATGGLMTFIGVRFAQAWTASRRSGHARSGGA